MFNVNRRQALALGGAASCRIFYSAAQRFARRRSDTLTIAYNVNLPVVRSDGRAVGGQPDHPGDLSLHLRSVYRPEARSVVRARPADQMGLERRQDQGLDGRARGRRLARRLAADARGRRLVARARRRSEDAAIRSSSSGATLGNFKIDGNRITADVKQFDPTIFKWMAFLTGYVLPKAYYRRSARKASRRSRSAPAPTWSTNIRATRSCG